MGRSHSLLNFNHLWGWGRKEKEEGMKGEAEEEREEEGEDEKTGQWREEQNSAYYPGCEILLFTVMASSTTGCQVSKS